MACFHSDTRLEPAILQKALNAVLPDDIAVLEVCEVPADFHPRYSANRKHYRYVIYNGPVRDIFARRYSWHFKKGRLDAEAMHRAAQPLLGKHDFTSFESSGAKRKTSVRTIFSLEIRRGRAGQGEVEGRCLPCLFLSPCRIPRIGSFSISSPTDSSTTWSARSSARSSKSAEASQNESWPGEVLLAADRRHAGPTAPPQGLFLVEVNYSEVNL